ncbi:transposase InsO family protein [Mucilaginibacter sp. SG538B]|jgi:transposase InsO family protein|nr:transposase InsO family protein [Mucilaginibacter sp. SG538B]
MGGRKLYVLLQAFLLEHQIKMGRDALFDLLAAHQLLVRKKRRRVYTTQSFHWLKKYPNCIKEIIPNKVNEIWVSDITYYRTTQGFVYISFITDAYSRKIVGYHAADTLEGVHTLSALQMALKENRQPITGLIHHSDRGVQYCSYDYVKLLQDNNIIISMTENGDPLENAIAERINGIMKQEYLEHQSPSTKEEVMELLTKSVKSYNNQRPHMSCNMLTPEFVHQNNIEVERTWKSYYKPQNVIL